MIKGLQTLTASLISLQAERRAAKAQQVSSSKVIPPGSSSSSPRVSPKEDGSQVSKERASKREEESNNVSVHDSYKVRLAARDLRNSKLATENNELVAEVEGLKMRLAKSEASERQAVAEAARLREAKLNIERELLMTRVEQRKGRLMTASAQGDLTEAKRILEVEAYKGRDREEVEAILGQALCMSAQGGEEGHREVASYLLGAPRMIQRTTPEPSDICIVSLGPHDLTALDLTHSKA